MRAGEKRSKPAATAVWVVKRFPARVAARATSKGWPGLFHETASALENGEGRVPLVQVTDLGLQAERAEQAPSADPEQQFLLQAQLRAAAVELAGDAAMRGIIRGVVAVEQIELHATDLNLPGAQPDRISRQRDFQPQPFAVWLAQRSNRQLPGIVVRKKRLLLAVAGRSPGGSSPAGRAVPRRPPARPDRWRL